jgi:hypothetical protein
VCLDVALAFSEEDCHFATVMVGLPYCDSGEASRLVFGAGPGSDSSS